QSYVHVDWGSSFHASHQAAFPEMAAPDVSISHGPLALMYLVAMGGSGYFRRSALRPCLEDRRLQLVPGAPAFSYSVHMVYSSRTEPGLVDRMREGFRSSSALHQVADVTG